MKLVELRCPRCNGTIRLDNNDKNIGICEYCNTRYFLLKDRGDDYRISEYKNYSYGNKNSSNEKKTNVKERKLRIILILTIIIAMFFTTFTRLMKQILLGNQVESSGVVFSETDSEFDKAESTGENNKNVSSELFCRFIEEVYQKPATDVTEEELSQIKYMYLKKEDSTYVISYSMEEPYPSLEDTAIEKVVLSDELQYESNDLMFFKGLEKLSIQTYFRQPDTLKKLENLQGIICNSMSVADISKLVNDTKTIKELGIGSDTLDGLSDFSNLEILSINNSSLTDLSMISALKNLISLELIGCNEISDFSVLSVMTTLQRLSIDSSNLKDINFLNNMSNLNSFSLENSIVIDIDALENNQNLTYLSLIDNSEINYYNAVETLKNLETLYIDKYSNKPDPNLQDLVNLKYLYISGFNSVSFLYNLYNLETLEIYGAELDDLGAFSGLVNLATLNARSFYGDIPSLEFIANLPKLKSVDLSGMEFYGNISELFNMSTLETLIMDEVEFELDFSQIQPNTTLKKLSLNNIKLYTNVDVQYDGMIEMVDYDDVIFDENTSFLSNYTGLAELSLEGNKLTKLDFIKDLTQLEILDINNNYINDINSLQYLEYLKLVKCEDNPITNYKVLSEKVEIIK